MTWVTRDPAGFRHPENARSADGRALVRRAGSAALQHHADVVRTGLAGHQRGSEPVGVRAVDHRAELEDAPLLVLGGLHGDQQGGPLRHVEQAGVVGRSPRGPRPRSRPGSPGCRNGRAARRRASRGAKSRFSMPDTSESGIQLVVIAIGKSSRKRSRSSSNSREPVRTPSWRAWLGGRFHEAGREDAGVRLRADGPTEVGEAHQRVGRLGDRRRDGVPPAAVARGDQAVLVQRGERASEGHPADVELLGEKALGGQLAALRDLARADLVGDQVADLTVGRLRARADGGQGALGCRASRHTSKLTCGRYRYSEALVDLVVSSGMVPRADDVTPFTPAHVPSPP